MVRLLDVLSTRVLPIGGFLYAIFLAVWDSRGHAGCGAPDRWVTYFWVYVSGAGVDVGDAFLSSLCEAQGLDV